MKSKCYQIIPYGIDLFKVPAVIGGAKQGLFGKLFLLIDTGASFTIISNKILEQLEYDLSKTTKKQQIITGKGITSPIPIISVSWFNCAGKIINNFELLGYDIPQSLKVDGILGMNFLVKHGAIIALNSQEIYFNS